MDTQSRFVYAVFSFPGTTEEDLPLVAGERIEVISRDDEFGDGWWEGINERGQQGLFPKIYTSEHYTTTSASASQSSLSESLARVDEEVESEMSADQKSVRSASLHESVEPMNEATRINQSTAQMSTMPMKVSEWTPDDVAAHFQNIGLGDISSKFAEHEVTGRILLAMQHTDLREIDINAFGKRFEIIKEIDQLRAASHIQNSFPVSGMSTPPLDISQRSAARQSRVMPQQSATGAILADLTSSGEEHEAGVRPLIPRPNTGDATGADPEVMSATARTNHARNDSGFGGSSDMSCSTPESGAAPKETILSSSSSMTNLHRKSLSTSSIALSTNQADSTTTGRKSPEKRHSRSWSQDTVKINTHKRGISGNLDIVGEEIAASINSTDSGPRSPSSPHGSPASGQHSSPSSTNRPALSSKKSLLSRRPKWRPNAVSENLETVAAPDAAKDADFSGWLRKRGEKSYNWKLRYFVLKGTRLAYFQSDRDTSEKGLIDINSHKVLPVDDILFYGPNRHTFKLVPPAPGASRALNFTAPKMHYFCAESKEQMRQWIAAFTKATIGRDWSTPVISSCTTKTISLRAAREQRGIMKPTNATDTLDTGSLQPSLDLDGLPSPKVLSPDEILTQQKVSTESVSRNLSSTSISSLRTAVLNASQDDFHAT